MPHAPRHLLRSVLLGALAVLAALAPLVVLPAAPARADSRVSVAGPDGTAAVDPTYATRLTVRGSGFQSLAGGHGGVYVFFGHVTDGWRPSQGGATGRDYFYVPDGEGRDNQGFQRFVAFPGSDTASSANGGSMTAGGGWSATITVPGAVFEAFDRDGGARTIDCRRLTCGILTVGAHGVVNARNETFTPVAVRDLQGGGEQQGAAPTSPATDTADDDTEPAPTTGTSSPGPGRAGDDEPEPEPGLEVDRASAVAGRVLAFSGAGLAPGAQVSAVLDDGLSAVGPLQAGADGRLAGVITLPADLPAGTHELRLHTGADAAPTVRFAVAAAPVPVAPDVEQAPGLFGQERAAAAFLALALVVLALAVLRLLLPRLSWLPRPSGPRRRRAAAA
ncbi:hypothetical protein ABKW28_00865 [Nocardioides sp. 31GB23]|uniref:hypothetical protein n=1 Tax=Nocardioides sp. 31GB23 TaxID=3156065 RepID=UPI0032AF6DAF